MMKKPFPVIYPVATGANIVRLREDRGLTVRDLQTYFGFEEPRAIYKWQTGQSLPTVDNLYALGALLDVTMDEILVQTRPKLNILVNEQQAKAACCSPRVRSSMNTARAAMRRRHPSPSRSATNAMSSSRGRRRFLPSRSTSR